VRGLAPIEGGAADLGSRPAGQHRRPHSPRRHGWRAAPASSLASPARRSTAKREPLDAGDVPRCHAAGIRHCMTTLTRSARCSCIAPWEGYDDGDRGAQRVNPLCHPTSGASPTIGNRPMRLARHSNRGRTGRLLEHITDRRVAVMREPLTCPATPAPPVMRSAARPLVPAWWRAAPASSPAIGPRSVNTSS
jgi:hypothetical protein